ncbi:cytochrome P450 2U1 [Trichonephila clavipes]|nr:cytochrome P450 2U1 [Trichonephila clavipes]
MAILSLLLELSKHPESQKAAQEEMDAVIGRERLPSFLDKQNLPYVDATLQELFRLAMVFRVSTMYSNFKETTIEGYRIPRRSIVMFNLWSINLDPELFPNPKVFNPKRFLDETGKRIKKDGPYPFSVGK